MIIHWDHVVMVNHSVIELALALLIKLYLDELFSVVYLVQVLLEFSFIVRVIIEDSRLAHLIFTLIYFIVKSLKLRQSLVIILRVYTWLELLIVFINVIFLAFLCEHLALGFRTVLVMMIDLILELYSIIFNILQ